ncbi:pyroglutamyl-peptidase I [Notoacmeibacter ruber]|uniref:Pyrrolidone-carboxylate peptidase n=1 Tax=Notoacmeibacter ruber TaxID=2670375 RepID=A0A3L7J990_9HYPH|nr:pyroglutamyl-peptidase I [Notoacmeibacter ruber]RLQ87298.1 pyroglutamyl-peptidase I [Notoacmeibacter ruber]
MGREARATKILVTGFTAFPGAPQNPTEWLMGALAGWRPSGSDIATAVLPVDYAAAPRTLEAIGADFAPDIAIHFGLALAAKGVCLERLARNRCTVDIPDNAGISRTGELIVADGDDCTSTLPLEIMAEHLAGASLPVEWSDDAGGYLCNLVMFHALSDRVARDYHPEMAGFIHVPLLERMRGDGQDDLHAMTEAQLLLGAQIIIGAALAAYRADLSKE